MVRRLSLHALGGSVPSETRRMGDCPPLDTKPYLYSEPCALFVSSHLSFGCASYPTFYKFMERHDASAVRPKEPDFNEHLAYLVRSTAMVSDPWFWPILAEVYERATPVLNDEIEQYIEHGSTLDPALTVPELSRLFAKLADGDGGITHKQKHT
eukprot:6198547-Pleurochrysis_carterae.AAC.1